MALCAIVDEIMSSETDAGKTYSNDGSPMSGVGLYVVHSLTINIVQRSLSTLAVFTESRESFKNLELTKHQILSAASVHKYSEQDILKKNIICDDRQYSTQSKGYKTSCRRT